MPFDQKVGEGWRCDGCGKVGRWDSSWTYYGSLWLADEGVLMWVACSKKCARAMPQEIKDLNMPGPREGLIRPECWDRFIDKLALIKFRLRASPVEVPTPP